MEQDSQENKQHEGSVVIENNILIVRVDLSQKAGKYLAKGLLIDAINAIDTYFMIAAQKRRQMEIIKPNGNGTH